MNPIMNMLMGQQLSPQLMQLARLMRNNNPQSILQMMAQQYPELGALMQSSNNMEQMCQMACKQKGIDYNSVMQQAQSILKQLNM